MSKILDFILNPHNQEVIVLPSWVGNAVGTVTFPSEKHYYQPLTMYHRFATDATVASRWQRIKYIGKSGRQMLEIGDNAAQAASNTYVYTAAYDYGGMTTGYSGSATNSRTAAFPIMLLTRGETITFSAVNGQAGDTYSLFIMRVAVIPKDFLRRINML